ncbi:flagellar biosynthetic protein FliP, partial [Rhodobacteraceae bacterium]|nr:flagellar biosynthetic protein FliP [Paracoccaceae bacterium]
MIRLMILLLFFAGTAFPVAAQAISISVGEGGSLNQTTLTLFALITILGIAPGVAVMVSCFPFILTVFSILRQALGLQQAPPNMLIVSLSLFLTFYIMEPVFMDAWIMGISPFMEGALDLPAAWINITTPFQSFMIGRVDPDILRSFTELRSHTA